MKNTIFFSTEKGNTYLHHLDLSLSMWVHPELSKAHKQMFNIEPYYDKKYTYLKEKGFFGEAKSIEFGTILEKSVIENNIAQIPQISFETTDHCNLKCSYCSLGDLYTFSKKEHQNINTQYALHLLKYIFNLKPKGAELTIGFFGGEPLANGKFIRTIVEEVKRLNEEKKLNISFTITTNATLINQYMDLLVNNNFFILISLDDNKKGQSYRKFANNNENSFDKVIHNIDQIYQKYPDFFKENIRFNSVLHNQNSVQEIYEFIYNRYHKIPTIGSLNTDHVNPKKKELLDHIFQSRQASEEAFHKSNSNLLTIMHDQSIQFKELSDYLSDYSINFYMINILDLLYDQVKPIPTKTCSPFQRKMYFSTNGRLLPCEKVSYKYFIGKVADIVEINIAEAAQRYSFYYKQIQKTCQHCYNWRTCSICLLTLDNLDDLGTDHFSCPNFLNGEAFGEKLETIFSFIETNPNDFAWIIKERMLNKK